METVLLLNRMVCLLGVISLAFFVMPGLARMRSAHAVQSIGLGALTLAYVLALVAGVQTWDVQHWGWVADGDGALRFFSGIVICVSIALYWISGAIEGALDAFRKLLPRAIR